ncbi:hypothetical protein Pint_31243 [Pistacia integerrima]|uniref:Uncharacterized protein n=1 Tax=Pistacia integerrima TaxID=434235 RepID=A0ACC0XSX9_9ROSI|nr:hypothetical protein Pint_31243 [Pistacia integerrima]
MNHLFVASTLSKVKGVLASIPASTSAESRNDFRDYAEVCFKEFGDRVKHWITLNEPWSYSFGGYTSGLLTPARCSEWQGMNCTGGDSATELYLVANNQLLAHASVVNLYKNKYQVH